MARIGFIGLGNMGGPMAANLAAAGHDVVGYDIVPQAYERARAGGLAVAPEPRAAVAGADVAITMLPAGRDVLDVYGRALGAAPAGTLWIDCSTIDVASARAAHAAAESAGMASLDAPVSGGVAGARAATLTFMAGGDGEAFARGEPVLAAMGRRIVHCGGAGAGQAAKLCNNLILGVTMIAVAEAFVLAERLGLSAKSLFDVVSSSSGQCWSLSNYCPVPDLVPASPANYGYRPGFAAKLMLKDLRLAEAAAGEAGAATPLAAEAADIFARFAADGHSEDDFSAIIQFVRAAGAGSGHASRDERSEPG